MGSAFKVGDHEYQTTMMSAFEQFDVARALRNVLTGLALVTDAVSKQPTATIDPKAFIQMMCAMSGGLTQEESDGARRLCLAKVERKHQAGWSLIAAPDGQLMLDDIKMPAMLEIMWNVLKINGLIDFFVASPSNSGTQELSPKSDGLISQTGATGSLDQH